MITTSKSRTVLMIRLLGMQGISQNSLGPRSFLTKVLQLNCYINLRPRLTSFHAGHHKKYNKRAHISMKLALFIIRFLFVISATNTCIQCRLVQQLLTCIIIP